MKEEKNRIETTEYAVKSIAELSFIDVSLGTRFLEQFYESRKGSIWTQVRRTINRYIRR